ncbi:MAG TPA: hypothetical protein VFG49_00470 [Dyella sp.]|uniref:hypothetical protein n=1 Tax=Dyella sp. TaxID=1869338 RepID=UPI002D78A733|nr:hypothetical protein [Dyella sp.]HET6551987.1 hypothetical protein [Dyella sp.]
MNNTKYSTIKRIALASVVLIGSAAVAPAFAGSHVSLNVGIGLPVVGPAYYAPAPVVYAPAPVVYAPAPVVYGPPAPVYYGPAVGAAVVVGRPGYYHHGGYYHRGGYRYYGH